jgi:CRISPR/Cas system CSM-associated protein Csm2 small subunit
MTALELMEKGETIRKLYEEYRHELSLFSSDLESQKNVMKLALDEMRVNLDEARLQRDAARKSSEQATKLAEEATEKLNDIRKENNDFTNQKKFLENQAVVAMNRVGPMESENKVLAGQVSLMKTRIASMTELIKELPRMEMTSMPQEGFQLVRIPIIWINKANSILGSSL